MSFDQNSLQLSIEFSEEARKTRVISVQNRTAGGLGGESLYRSSGVSGSLTVFGVAGVSYDSEDTEAFTRSDPQLQLEQILHWGNTTFESHGSTEGRQDTRLVQDIPRWGLRALLGDFQSRKGLLSNPLELLGFSIANEIYSSASRLQLYANGQYFLRLRRKSRVEVWVNGQSIAVFYLEPGAYDFRDFPSAPGFVETQIRVQDDLGGVEVFDASYFLSPRLLGVGVSDFQYYFGIPRKSREGGAKPIYDDQTSVSGFSHRRGFSGSLTAELDFRYEGSRALSQAAVGIGWAQRVGLMEWIMLGNPFTVSSWDDLGFYMAQTIELTGLSRSPSSILKLEVERESPIFSEENTPRKWMRGTLVSGLGERFSLSLGVTRLTEGCGSQILPRVGLHYLTRSRLSLSLSAMRERGGAQEPLENRLEFSFNWSSPQKSVATTTR